jgi:hypothetical protein
MGVFPKLVVARRDLAQHNHGDSPGAPENFSWAKGKTSFAVSAGVRNVAMR